MSKPNKVAFKEAANFVKKDRFEKGCGQWLTMYEQQLDSGVTEEQHSAALLFNLGLCSERQDDYDGALEFYTAADDRTTKSDRAIQDALDRMRQAKAAIQLFQN